MYQYYNLNTSFRILHVFTYTIQLVICICYKYYMTTIHVIFGISPKIFTILDLAVYFQLVIIITTINYIKHICLFNII